MQLPTQLNLDVWMYHRVGLPRNGLLIHLEIRSGLRDQEARRKGGAKTGERQLCGETHVFYTLCYKRSTYQTLRNDGIYEKRTLSK